MKKNLLLPIAGESSRFAGKKPKWALQHPSGLMMITEAIRGLETEIFDNIYLIGLKKHKEHIHKAKKEIEEEYSKKANSILLKHQTKNQPETIIKAIEKGNIQGSILIKDCDASFQYQPKWNTNHIAVANLNEVGRTNAGNKSYVQVDKNKTVGNIAEKQVISHLFNCGAYYFTSAKEFVDYYNKIERKEGLYISHIIYRMLLDKNIFFIEEVTDYHDWGTQEDWNEYKRKMAKDKSIVLDLDGTIAKISKKAYENREVIKKIKNKIWEYKKNGFYITIQTSRQMNTYDGNIGIINKKTAPITIEWLERNNIPFDEIYYGRPWCGHNGFYVCDKTITPEEFIEKNYTEIKTMVKR